MNSIGCGNVAPSGLTLVGMEMGKIQRGLRCLTEGSFGGGGVGG